ncbi:hypothetical protein K438DRAFT_1973950 [Mycena galopus ATCC 62051]|nr:hypothetical protein K438DRAFT_1973950 [Mycena galopus ATCC 62051]
MTYGRGRPVSAGAASLSIVIVACSLQTDEFRAVQYTYVVSTRSGLLPPRTPSPRSWRTLLRSLARFDSSGTPLSRLCSRRMFLFVSERGQPMLCSVGKHACIYLVIRYAPCAPPARWERARPLWPYVYGCEDEEEEEGVGTGTGTHHVIPVDRDAAAGTTHAPRAYAGGDEQGVPRRRLRATCRVVSSSRGSLRRQGRSVRASPLRSPGSSAPNGAHSCVESRRRDEGMEGKGGELCVGDGVGHTYLALALACHLSSPARETGYISQMHLDPKAADLRPCKCKVL